jgi:hypothetical protein
MLHQLDRPDGLIPEYQVIDDIDRAAADKITVNVMFLDEVLLGDDAVVFEAGDLCGLVGAEGREVVEEAPVGCCFCVAAWEISVLTSRFNSERLPRAFHHGYSF